MRQKFPVSTVRHRAQKVEGSRSARRLSIRRGRGILGISQSKGVLNVDLYHDIDLQDCPLCHGPGIIEEEAGWCLYVTCLDCGCRTAELSFSTPEEHDRIIDPGQFAFRTLSAPAFVQDPHRRGRLSRSAPRPSRKKRPPRSMAPGRAAVFSPRSRLPTRRTPYAKGFSVG